MTNRIWTFLLTIAALVPLGRLHASGSTPGAGRR